MPNETTSYTDSDLDFCWYRIEHATYDYQIITDIPERHVCGQAPEDCPDREEIDQAIYENLHDC